MTHEERQALKALLEVLVKHHGQLDYPRDDVRGPLDAATFHLTRAQALARLANGQHLMFDCSGAITCAYKWTKLKDPNGLDYRREGYTGTMLDHLHHYSDPRQARVGAIVIFGPATGEHGAVVLEPGDDPLLFSHGLAAAAGPVRLSVERTFHHPPVTFLDVSGL